MFVTKKQQVVLDAIPGTAREISEKTGISQAEVWYFLTNLYAMGLVEPITLPRPRHLYGKMPSYWRRVSS